MGLAALEGQFVCVAAEQEHQGCGGCSSLKCLGQGFSPWFCHPCHCSVLPGCPAGMALGTAAPKQHPESCLETEETCSIAHLKKKLFLTWTLTVIPKDNIKS